MDSSEPDSDRGPFLAALGQGLFYLFGVALPLATLAFELLTHGAAQVYFDPIPTWIHAGLVAFVPAAALWVDWSLRRGTASRGACAAGGFALGIALFYAVLFLPLLPISVPAILYMGLGLLCFAPLGAALALARRSRHLARRAPGATRWLWSFAGAGALVLLLLEIPGWIVAHGLETGDVALLQRWGSGDAMRRATHRGVARVNLTNHLWNGSERFFPFGIDRVDAEELRRNQRLFYRATGEDPGALGPPSLVGAPRPRLFAGLAFRDPWGRNLGRPEEGLFLAASRLDAIAFGEAAVAYTEWTLLFRNDAERNREARARLILPPGGVVTRATLWVDGEERDAAFGPRRQVTEAYEGVSRTGRDPVLVTSDRPGQAELRASPVPADGGTLRMRVGITAPLELRDPERGLLHLPRIAESNFAPDPELEHAVWVDSRGPVLEPPPAFETTPGPGSSVAVRGSLPSLDALEPLVLAREARPSEEWVRDALSGDGATIRQRLEPPAATEGPRWAVVVDGSAGAAPHLDRVAEALGALPGERLVALLVARDQPVELLAASAEDAPPTDADRDAALARLQGLELRGGQDNRRALSRAWDLALRTGDTTVLWLTAPQPVPLGPPAGLLQRLERRPGIVPILTVPLASGRHALLAELPAALGVRALPPAANGELAALLRHGPDTGGWRLARERFEQPPASASPLRDPSHPVAVHLTRLWARDRVAAILGEDPRQGWEQAAALATRYRVVTPVSGAVVLERDAQYEAANLDVPEPTEGDPRMVAVPEPGASVLLLLLAAAGLGVRLRIAPRNSR